MPSPGGSTIAWFAMPLPVKAPAQRRKVMARDLLVGDDDRLPPPQQRQHRRAGGFDQSGTDENVVAPFRKRDAQALRRG